MFAIDRNAWTNRWSRRHPLEKLTLALGMLALAVTLPPLTTGPLVLTVMAAAAILGAGVPGRDFAAVLALPVAFLLPSLLLIALAIDLDDGIRVGLSAAAARQAADVGARSVAAMSCLAFLVLTTPVTDVLAVLRRAGLPAPVVELMFLIYRLVFVFVERGVAARRAQAARLGYATPRRSVRSLGHLAAGLFQRALARGRRLEIGLAARGHSDDLRVLPPDWIMAPLDYAYVAMALAAVAAAGLALHGLTA